MKFYCNLFDEWSEEVKSDAKIKDPLLENERKNNNIYSKKFIIY